jgi:hypothetical protein
LCFGLGTGGSLVRNRLGSPIRVPTLSGNRRSAHKQGLGFPPLKGLGARASCPSALSAGLPLAPYKQAALSLVRTPTCRDQELSSNKICTGRPLGGHVADLVVLYQVDASGAPLSSYPRWLIRYLVGAVCPSRGSTGTPTATVGRGVFPLYHWWHNGTTPHPTVAVGAPWLVHI